jgi:hypothetical protein
MLAAPGLFLIDPLPPPASTEPGGRSCHYMNSEVSGPCCCCSVRGGNGAFSLAQDGLHSAWIGGTSVGTCRDGPGSVPCRHACVCVCVCVCADNFNIDLPSLPLACFPYPPPPIPSLALGSCVPLAPSLHAWDRSYIWKVGACMPRAERSNFPFSS